MASAYGGTMDKCKVCDKTVYAIDQLTIDNQFYHRACFRCKHCNHSSSFDGVLYCKPHYDQLFMLTGSLEKSFEGAPKAEKSDRSNGVEIGVDGGAYHKARFKCAQGGCKITSASCVLHDEKLYCEFYNVQLFLAKGIFQYEDKSTADNPSSDEVAEEQPSNREVEAAPAES